MSGKLNGATPAPTPGLVVAVGALGTRIAADVQTIFLRGDPRRAAATTFLTLQFAGAGGQAALVERAEPQEAAPLLPQEACRQVAVAAAGLRSAIVGALRELRTHERLAAAGLDEVMAPPLDVYLVADLTDPAAAGALPPLSLLLQDILAQEPDGVGHLLLSTAAFPASEGEAAQEQALVYASLQALDTWTDPQRCASWQPLAAQLGLEQALPCGLRVYLFDSRKEGTREVKDLAELVVIMGNCLLALLSGGLAQRLAAALPVSTLREHRAPYSSAGASALIFEPEILLDACAARLADEFLGAEVVPGVIPDPQLAAGWADEVIGQAGPVRRWIERVCAETPAEIRATEDEWSIGLHFARFGFERIDKEAWAEAIDNYDALFGRTKLPAYRQAMDANAQALTQALIANQDAAIEALPQQPSLYPGGLAAARRALQRLSAAWTERGEKVGAVGAALPPREKEDLAALELAAREFPDLPAFIGRLILLVTLQVYSFLTIAHGLAPDRPAGGPWAWAITALVGLLIVGACVLWLWRKARRLIVLRERCVGNSEAKYAAVLEGMARERLATLCQTLNNRISAALEQLAGLEKEVATARDVLVRRQERPEGQDTFFRVQVSDAGVVNWAYRRWRIAPEDLRQPLFVEGRLLTGWRSLTAVALVERLLTHMQPLFADVRGLTLQDVLIQRGREAAQHMLLGLPRDAVPLQRPNFDRLGGGGNANERRYLVNQPTALVAGDQQLQSAFADWELVTGDPYAVISCRTRQMLPLAALRELVRQSHKAYLGLDEATRTTLHAVADWVSLPDLESDNGRHGDRNGGGKTR